MSVNDPLGDMLTRIRNAHMRRKTSVRVPAAKLQGWVLDVLRDEGFIRGYEKVAAEKGHAEFDVALKYFDGRPVIREIARVSTPGRRVYYGVKDLPQVRNGLGVSIVSTSRGVMSDAKARAENVGGEVLARVF
jgi:small subunit ribosomal protein S8